MKKFFKILAVVFIVLIVAVVALLTYVKMFMPNVPIEEVKIEITPERVKRGEYLAHNVAQCVDCHSQRDWTRFSGPNRF